MSSPSEKFEEKLRDLVHQAHENGVPRDDIISSLELVKMSAEELFESEDDEC